MSQSAVSFGGRKFLLAHCRAVANSKKDLKSAAEQPLSGFEQMDKFCEQNKNDKVVEMKKKSKIYALLIFPGTKFPLLVLEWSQLSLCIVT